MPIVPILLAAAPNVSGWLSDPATVWDIFKFMVPMILAMVAWAWRVENRISKHDMILDRLTTTMEKIEHTLSEWTDVKERRAERLATIEAKVDILLAKANRNDR